MKSRDGKSQREEKSTREKSRREKIREEKESEERRCRCAKSRKVAKHGVFPMICGSGGSKSRLAKAAGAEASGQMRDEKLHAVKARSTFRSQHVQSAPFSDHFWKLRCRKSARRCGAKHISKSKCTKHLSFGALLRVAMWKKCTPLWREAHFDTTCSRHFWTFRCRFAWQAQGIVDLIKSEQYLKVLYHFQLQPPLHHTILQHTTLQLQLHLHYIPLHYTALHYTTLELHYATFHYTTLHYTPLHFTTLKYTTLHYATLHYTTLHSTTLHYTTLNYTTLHYITLHYATQHYTPLHSTTLHYTTIHSITLHYTTFHYTTLH